MSVETELEPEFVTLKGGVTLPLGAILLALRLEERGVTLSLDRDGALLAGPRRLIEPDDIEAIRRHREDLKRIVTYCDEVDVT